MLHFLANRKYTRTLVLLSFVFVLGGFLLWQEVQAPQNTSPQTHSENSTELTTDGTTEKTEVTAPIEYIFVAPESMTAEELLNQEAEVEYQNFGTAGKFVQSINGVEGNSEYFWAFYVNDAFAEAGVSQTQLQMGDTIRFTYEKVEPLQE